MKNVTESTRACVSCGRSVPIERALKKCQPCHAAQTAEWRDSMTLEATKEFPGVDIDAIYKRRRK